MFEDEILIVLFQNNRYKIHVSLVVKTIQFIFTVHFHDERKYNEPEWIYKYICLII